MILASVFRNSTGYLDRYIAQVKALREVMPVHVVAVEGDSTDDTYDALRATDFEVLKAEHGGPLFPSIDHPLRWRQIASACNVALAAAVRHCTRNDEPLVYIESDLKWDPDTIQGLIADLDDVPAVAPLSLIENTEQFWDIWGHVKDKARFNSQPPYADLTPDLSGLVPIDSAGSCFAVRADVTWCLEFSSIDCIRGIGRSLRRHGYRLYLDPSLKVEHPNG